MQMGIVNKRAPELRIAHWIGEDGLERPQLQLSDLGDGYKLLYCFQHWCPGCHSRGFPTLKRLVEKLEHRGFGFAVIQTVFEGSDTNTAGKLREDQLRYELRLPFGHDTPPEGERHPTIMEDYRTAGTPWFIVINPDGEVIYNDFRLDADRFIAALEHEDVKFLCARLNPKPMLICAVAVNGEAIMTDIGFNNTRFDPDLTPFHDLAKAMAAAFGYTASLEIDQKLAQLVRLRVAQNNNCSYCLILHARAARDRGIADGKIDGLGSWWESNLYSAEERAALGYCDALTEGDQPGFQNVHDIAVKHFTEKGIAELAAIIINMNLWTRLKLAQGATPDYK